MAHDDRGFVVASPMLCNNLPVSRTVNLDRKLIAVICVTKSRTGDYDFRACARARGFRGSTFSVGRICFAVCAERSRDKTCVF